MPKLLENKSVSKAAGVLSVFRTVTPKSNVFVKKAGATLPQVPLVLTDGTRSMLLRDDACIDLIPIPTDPAIPDGSLENIWKDYELSPFRKGVEARADFALADVEKQSLLKDMRKMLWGRIAKTPRR